MEAWVFHDDIKANYLSSSLGIDGIVVYNVRDLGLDLDRVGAHKRQVIGWLYEEVLQVLLVVEKGLQACDCDVNIIPAVGCLYKLVSAGDRTQEIANCILDIWDGVQHLEIIDKAWFDIDREIAVGRERLKCGLRVVIEHLNRALNRDRVSTHSRDVISLWHNKLSFRVIMDGPERHSTHCDSLVISALVRIVLEHVGALRDGIFRNTIDYILHRLRRIVAIH